MERFRNIMRTLRWSNFFCLTLAGVVNAFGVILFMAPVKLYDSGISGTSMLISQVTPAWCSLSVVLIVLNIPIFLFGLKREGISFTIYAIYAVFVYALVAWIITDVLPVDVSLVSPLAGSDLFLCALFGGMISGCGSGMAVRFGGAMDGIDIIAVMFAKRVGLSIGSFVMIYNVILYVICGFVIGSWILPLYSIVAYAAASKTVDFFVEGFDRAKAAFIITTKPEAVCSVLSEAFENGITTIRAKGYYSDSDKTMVYFVVNRFQVGKMKNLVHEVDAKAYITLNEVADIFPANQEEHLNGHAGAETVKAPQTELPAEGQTAIQTEPHAERQTAIQTEPPAEGQTAMQTEPPAEDQTAMQTTPQTARPQDSRTEATGCSGDGGGSEKD